jgi:hypothetical protein
MAVWFGGLGNMAWVLLLLRQDRASFLLHRLMGLAPTYHLNLQFQFDTAVEIEQH